MEALATSNGWERYLDQLVLLRKFFMNWKWMSTRPIRFECLPLLITEGDKVCVHNYQHIQFFISRGFAEFCVVLRLEDEVASWTGLVKMIKYCWDGHNLSKLHFNWNMVTWVEMVGALGMHQPVHTSAFIITTENYCFLLIVETTILAIEKI